MKVIRSVINSLLCLTARIFRINLQFATLYLEIVDRIGEKCGGCKKY
jgi:hypothetical protein